mmetsp:Transcript_36524/g.82121  ORF Transcript_36524/g.82121 Transcript_36524/m.82121 type:complete len:282 (-) Transcript_36524:561-1406(-)
MHYEFLHSLQNYSNALSPSNACTSDVDVTVRSLELIGKMSNYPTPARPQRMTKADRAAMQISPVHIQTQLLRAGQELCRKRFVDFDPVHLIKRQAGRGKGAPDRGHGPDPHDGGLAPRHLIRGQPRQGLQVVLFHRILRCEYDGSGSVADSACVRSRHDPVLLENWSKRADLFERRLRSGVLVDADNLSALLGLDLDRGQFQIEHPVFVRLAPGLLRSDRKLVAFLSGNAVFFCEVLGGYAHRSARILISQAVPQRIAHRQTLAEAHAPADVVAVDLQRRH